MSNFHSSCATLPSQAVSLTSVGGSGTSEGQGGLFSAHCLCYRALAREGTSDSRVILLVVILMSPLQTNYSIKEIIYFYVFFFFFFLMFLFSEMKISEAINVRAACT